jgi:hypothetical protein
MNGAVLLVTGFLFERTTAVVVVAVVATIYVTLWFGVGLARRLAL